MQRAGSRTARGELARNRRLLCDVLLQGVHGGQDEQDVGAFALRGRATQTGKQEENETVHGFHRTKASLHSGKRRARPITQDSASRLSQTKKEWRQARRL